MNPVLVISDTHYHNFTQYANVNANGLNSRLGDTIRATFEAANELKKRGGKVIVHCGDVFHVRGSLAPSVLNPVVAMYERLVEEGFKVHMISGNHDLETDLAASMSSSVTALQNAGVQVYNKDTVVTIEGTKWRFIPWVKDLTELRALIKANAWGATKLVVHAPLNGVIEGLPEHGLVPKDFEGAGYNEVFCGHYHNHKRFPIVDGDVYSVGALTHQNWGDTQSRAGYIILTGLGRTSQHETNAPKFVKMDFVDLDLHADSVFTDNYVKVTGGSFTDPSEIQEVKDALLLKGAKAVVVEGLTKRPTTTRGTIHTTAPTLQTILGDYLDRTFPGDPSVKMEALDILSMVEE